MPTTENLNPEVGKQDSPESEEPYVPVWMRRKRARQRVYLGILIYVVVAGLPMIGFPSLRARLQSRIERLRAAALGYPPPPVPTYARIGENTKPFPSEYEHPVSRSSYLAPLELLKQAEPYIMRIGGGEATSAGTGTGVAEPPVPLPTQSATTGTTATDADSEPQFRKGESEQAAYDLLVSSNKTLAGMIQGSDASLKFEDWGAASMGQDSYYVMVTFVQVADNVARKYIWDVKLESKEVRPLSSYAMSISK
jgi:hypothetical protein